MTAEWGQENVDLKAILLPAKSEAERFTAWHGVRGTFRSAASEFHSLAPAQAIAFDAAPFPASYAAQVRDTLEDLQNFGIDVANNNRRGVRTNFPFPERLKEWS
jgi:hypothetical protein